MTDGDTHPSKEGYAEFWRVVDEAVTGMGFPSLWSKFHLPLWLLVPAAHVSDWIGWAIGRKLKLNPFNVRVLVMHRWFRIDAAEKDLKFKPIIGFDKGWPDAIAWFRDNWLPNFQKQTGIVGIAAQSQRKIDIQAAGTSKTAAAQAAAAAAAAETPKRK